MNNKFIKFLLKPPTWFIILSLFITILFCACSLVFVALNLSTMVYSYIVFAFAGITLAYSTYLLVKYIPRLKRSIMNFITGHKFTNRLYSDYAFRTSTFACVSLFINICFSVFEITISIISHSIWYGALGSYHLILSITRFSIFVKTASEKKKFSENNEDTNWQLKIYKNTGICVLIFNLALVGAIAQMMFSRRAFVYAGLMIYVMATYAFFKITVSILGLIKAKKYNDYSLQSFRNLNMTDALVSIYALQTALIATFSEANGTDMKIMNLLTGIAITVLSISIGIYMIVKAHKEQRKLKEKDYEGIKEV